MENPLTCSTMPGNFTDDENVPSELCPVKTRISLHMFAMWSAKGYVIGFFTEKTQIRLHGCTG